MINEYVCGYMYVYVYVHVCVSIWMYVCISVYVSIYMCADMCVYVYIQVSKFHVRTIIFEAFVLIQLCLLYSLNTCIYYDTNQ